MNQTPFRTILGLLLLLLSCAPATGAEPGPDAVDYGFKTYFRYHPPKDKAPSRNLYPFAGPVIAAGQDIPVCAAAQNSAAYAAARDMRYIVHGRDGWLFRTADFRMDFSASAASLSYFSRLSRALAEKGQTLVVVLQPPRAMVEFQHADVAAMPRDYSAARARKNYQDFIGQLREAGIRAVDLSDAPPGQDYFPKGDAHWSPDGAIWSAAAVAKEVRGIPSFLTLPRQKFETRVIGLAAPARGSYEDFIQRTCGVNIQMTSRPIWTTEAAGPHGGAFPGVTLLGTSNSAEDAKFNFLGALKKSLGTDVYDAAATTGGFGFSPFSYFASDEYRNHPPKIIIWEIPSQYNYNNSGSLASFRQMLPAIDGGCDDKAALATWSGNLAGDAANIFSDPTKLPLRNAYLYLETAADPAGPLKTEILYKDGEADEIDLTRSPRAAEGGRYYLTLGDATAAPALFFHVLADKPGGRMTARLCRARTHFAEK